ncbi:hypothetical protein KIPB_005463 [Kipferlia bialata]|uniref:DUF4470 domain-containing protein n=1 Tax=Kipferlia bialata TaxID=797122 RepID=A0A9K3CX81_9EUKA|nr:hypothetical protein KIPB_005463 [Kipferlia bialata]|eukprot:g5463.t1
MEGLDLSRCVNGNRIHHNATPPYYPFGNTPPHSLLDTVPHRERTGELGVGGISILTLGSGDIRHVLQTVLSISHGLPKCPPLDISQNDILPSILARNTLLLYMLSRVPPAGTPTRTLHIRASIDAWYCSTTTPARRAVVMEAIGALSISLESAGSLSRLDLLNDGREGVLRCLDNTSRERVREVYIFWLGLPAEVPDGHSQELLKHTRTMPGLPKEMARDKGRAEYIEQLATDTLSGMTAYPDTAMPRDRRCLDLAVQEVEGYLATGGIRWWDAEKKAYSTPTELCPPLFYAETYPYTNTSVPPLPYTAGVSVALFQKERADILASRTPLASLLKHSMGVWADALCGRGVHSAAGRIRSLELCVGDMVDTCDTLRQMGRRYATVDSSNVPDYVGILQYLVSVVPVLREGDSAVGTEPGRTRFESISMSMDANSTIEAHLSLHLGIPLHLWPVFLGCLATNAVPKSTGGAEIPLENYIGNDATCLHTKITPPTTQVVHVQRVPSPLYQLGSGSIPVAPTLSSKPLAGTLAGLIRRCVPSGCHVPTRLFSYLSPSGLVRMLLQAVADGRISPDVGTVSADVSDPAPLSLGMDVMEYLLRDKTDWCSLKELFLVFKADGLAIPESQAALDPVRMTLDISGIDLTPDEFEGGHHNISLLLSHSEAAAEVPHRAAAECVRGKRGSGVGLAHDLYIAACDGGNRVTAIVDARYAMCPVGLCVMFHEHILEDWRELPGKMAVRLGASGTEVMRAAQLFQKTGHQVVVHVSQAVSIPPERVTVEPLSVPVHEVLHLYRASPVEGVTYNDNHRVTVRLRPDVGCVSATLIGTSPSRDVSVQTEDGSSLTLRMLQYATAVTRVKQSRHSFTVSLSPLKPAPIFLASPNTHRTLDPSDPAVLSKLLDGQLATRDLCSLPEYNGTSVPMVASLFKNAVLTGHLEANTLRFLSGSDGAKNADGRPVDPRERVRMLPEQSVERRMLESHLINVACVRTGVKSGACVVVSQPSGDLSGFVYVQQGIYNVCGCTSVARGVVFCPPPPTDAAAKRVLGAFWFIKGLDKQQVPGIGPAGLRAYASMQQYATHSVPQLFQGVTPKDILPQSVWVSTPPALRQYFTVIAVMYLPARDDAIRIQWQSERPKLKYNKKSIEGLVPDTCTGRVGNARIAEGLELAIRVRYAEKSRRHILYCAYNQDEVAAVAKEDQKRDWKRQ